MQITVDGFISGQNGEMDWMCFPWTDDIINYVREITEPVDTIILGRKLAEGFIPHWENVVQDPRNPEYEGGIKYTTIPKVVFTKTIEKSIWNNTTVAKGELVEEITKLKNQSGNDIIAQSGDSTWQSKKTEINRHESSRKNSKGNSDQPSCGQGRTV